MHLGAEPICQVTHDHEVVIGNKTARLQIRPSVNAGTYMIFWYIAFSAVEFVNGCLQMHSSDLRRAFILIDIASTTLAGHYIRRGRFLKLPTRGASDDGDPNISVCLSDDIREAVARLLESQG